MKLSRAYGTKRRVTQISESASLIVHFVSATKRLMTFLRKLNCVVAKKKNIYPLKTLEWQIYNYILKLEASCAPETLATMPTAMQCNKPRTGININN
jgi:hypothetical protein